MMNEHEELIKNGYKFYESEDIIVYWNLELCVHSGICTRGNPEVFKVGRRPWIKLDNDDPKKIAEVIDACPSAALKYCFKKV